MQRTLLAQVPADDYAGGALSLLNKQTRTLGFLTLSLALLTVLGVFGLHWAARTTATKIGERANGILNLDGFESRLEDAAIQHSDSPTSVHRAVLVIECQNLKYLADRSGQSLNSDVLQSLAAKVAEHLSPDEFLCCTDHDRILISLSAKSYTEVQQRIKIVDQATASAGLIETLDGQKRLSFARGAAVHEPGAPMSNLLHRAREALALGIEESTNGIRMADFFFAIDDTHSNRAA